MKTLVLIAFLMSLSLSVFCKGYSPGDKAVGFKLKNIDDKIVSLGDYSESKGFIVIFTCNHCPYSVAYEDRIIALDKKYKSKGYPVIAISSNDAKAYPSDSFEKMKERAEEKGFTFPYLYDESQVVAKTYGATRTPHAFVLEKKDNELFVRYIGAIDNNTQNAAAANKKYIEGAVDNLLESKKVKVDFTKAIGCSIKWK